MTTGTARQSAATLEAAQANLARCRAEFARDHDEGARLRLRNAHRDLTSIEDALRPEPVILSLSTLPDGWTMRLHREGDHLVAYMVAPDATRVGTVTAGPGQPMEVR